MIHKCVNENINFKKSMYPIESNSSYGHYRFCNVSVVLPQRKFDERGYDGYPFTPSKN